MDLAGGDLLDRAGPADSRAAGVEHLHHQAPVEQVRRPQAHHRVVLEPPGKLSRLAGVQAAGTLDRAPQLVTPALLERLQPLLQLLFARIPDVAADGDDPRLLPLARLRVAFRYRPTDVHVRAKLPVVGRSQSPQQIDIRRVRAGQRPHVDEAVGARAVRRLLRSRHRDYPSLAARGPQVPCERGARAAPNGACLIPKCGS